MFNQARSRMFVVFMFVAAAVSAIAIYSAANSLTGLFNLGSTGRQGVGAPAADPGEARPAEISPRPSQVEAGQLSSSPGAQEGLPDLAPTLVKHSIYPFLIPDLAPTLVTAPSNGAPRSSAPRSATDLPDLAPTLTNPEMSPYRFSDLAPTLVKPSEGAERLPDLEPTIVDSEDEINRLPDLEPTLP